VTVVPVLIAVAVLSAIGPERRDAVFGRQDADAAIGHSAV
jgi:hypothetical protein